MVDDEEFEFQIEARLTSHGVYVDEVDHEEATYSITYESISTANEGAVPHREVGRVINVFRDLHEDDWEGERIEAVVTDLDGVEQGTWHVKQEWIDKLHNGDLTEVEFSQKVVDTIEHTNES